MPGQQTNRKVFREVLTDIAHMPGANPAVKNGWRSVTSGLVYFGRTGLSDNEIATVCCTKHGAMNCMAKTVAGKIWRCTTCNEGAFLFT